MFVWIFGRQRVLCSKLSCFVSLCHPVCSDVQNVSALPSNQPTRQSVFVASPLLGKGFLVVLLVWQPHPKNPSVPFQPEHRKDPHPMFGTSRKNIAAMKGFFRPPEGIQWHLTPVASGALFPLFLGKGSPSTQLTKENGCPNFPWKSTGHQRHSFHFQAAAGAGAAPGPLGGLPTPPRPPRAAGGAAGAATAQAASAAAAESARAAAGGHFPSASPPPSNWIGGGGSHPWNSI